MPLHGHQEQRFFHGYYDGYCYLPLYIFCGEHLLCARLRPANQDAAAGCVEEVQCLVAQIRQAWPKVQVILRGDSGFCRDALMSWCESNRVDYVLGLARNSRLEGSAAPWLAKARARQTATGKPARIFGEFVYQTVSGTWSRARRVVAKAEVLGDKENPRFFVVCGDLAAGAAVGPAGAVRGRLLRTGRDGEPDQRAVIVVCGPGQYGDDAGKPDAVVPKLCTGGKAFPPRASEAAHGRSVTDIC